MCACRPSCLLTIQHHVRARVPGSKPPPRISLDLSKGVVIPVKYPRRQLRESVSRVVCLTVAYDRNPVSSTESTEPNGCSRFTKKKGAVSQKWDPGGGGGGGVRFCCRGDFSALEYYYSPPSSHWKCSIKGKRLDLKIEDCSEMIPVTKIRELRGSGNGDALCNPCLESATYERRGSRDGRELCPREPGHEQIAVMGHGLYVYDL